MPSFAAAVGPPSELGDCGFNLGGSELCHIQQNKGWRLGMAIFEGGPCNAMDLVTVVPFPRARTLVCDFPGAEDYEEYEVSLPTKPTWFDIWRRAQKFMDDVGDEHATPIKQSLTAANTGESADEAKVIMFCFDT